MRRLSTHITSLMSLAVLAGGLYWGGPKVLSQLELSSVPDAAIETLSAVGLNVEEVTVEGRINTLPADILEALGAVRGTPILDISVPQAQQRIAALPWVRSAEIVRHLPNSLHITLEEHVPFAMWQHEGKYKLVAADGTAITDVEYAQPDLTILVGEDAPAHAAALFAALAGQPHLTSRVKAAVRLGQRRWNVILDSVDQGILVKLPETAVSEAWDTLATLDAQHGLLDRAIAEADLRISGRLTVKLLDGYGPIAPNTSQKLPAQDVNWNAGPDQLKESVHSV